jgi:hypothetical protein
MREGGGKVSVMAPLPAELVSFLAAVGTPELSAAIDVELENEPK